jgi:nitroreductase
VHVPKSTILDTIYSRRSIRIFDRRSVGKDILIDLLKAAMAAPSASNSRPWEFVVVTDKIILKELQSKIKYGKYNAPAAAIVCANLSIAKNESAYRFWVQDCSAATENLLIAAAGLGLGTVWVGAYPKEDVMQTLRDILEIPQDVYPLNIIYIGYPAEKKEARTQFEETRVHWEKY